MKVFVATAACLSPLLGSAASVKRSVTSVDASFGPQNCVTLTRSSAGSCVISTDCEGADLSQTEFSFDCIRKGGEIVRHSFGTGGFDPSEEFDTEVKCDRCETTSPADVVMKPAAPAPKKEVVAPAPKIVVSEKPKTEVPHTVPAPVVFKAKQRQQLATNATAESTAKATFWPFTSAEKKEEPEVVKYGPNGCVSTWRSSEGHCIMRTNCKKEDITKYEFGLVCVDKVGSPVRHLFGQDSFDPEETFDTLIKCDKCLGLEDIPDAVALNGEVMTLSKDIGNLKAVMKNISINVQMLNAEVFKSGPAPAPAAAAGPPAAALVHQSSSVQRISDVAQADHTVKKHNLRHSHKKHRREDDEDEDEDDDRESDVQDAVLHDDRHDDEDEADDED